MPPPLRRRDRPGPGRPVTVTVVHGSLRWGYHVAASIRDATITRTRRGATLVGGVASFDRFRTSQKPLYFVALITGGAWQWPVKRLEINDKTVRAELGPQE
jgi:hypothetical protein